MKKELKILLIMPIKIQKFIKINYLEMFEKWSMDSNKGFFDQQ